MRCQDVANLLDEHAELHLSPSEKDEVDGHLARCDECANAWRSGFILRSYRAMAAPSPRPSLFAESVATARGAAGRRTGTRAFWWGAGVGSAMAAGITLLAVLLFAPSPSPDDTAGFSIPALTMTLNETRNVSLGIDSTEALEDVQVRVLLVGGIRLERFGDRSSIDWRTTLDAGVNRLILPVVALDDTGGDILVEVAHGEKSKFFVMHIDVDDPDYVKNMEPMRLANV